MTMTVTESLRACGHPLDTAPDAFGELRRSDDKRNDAAELRRRLAEDGYLYMPGFFSAGDIQHVREEFIRRLQAQGALNPDHPASEGISADAPDLQLRELVRDNDRVRSIVFGRPLLEFYERLLGGAIRHYDHVWIRCGGRSASTPSHCDRVYMGRGTVNVMTAWIPYGDVPLQRGGLMLLEGSHKRADRLQSYWESDADTYCENRQEYLHKSGYLEGTPAELHARLGGRWLTTHYHMGDLLTFGMHMVHASLENQTSAFRLSTDTRYQLASEPIDHRWVGPDTEEYAARNRVGKIC